MYIFLYCPFKYCPFKSKKLNLFSSEKMIIPEEIIFKIFFKKKVNLFFIFILNFFGIEIYRFFFNFSYNNLFSVKL